MYKIRTTSGRLVDPFNLTAEDVEPHVIMRALSNISRFTGHSVYPYSVGQHTLALVHLVPKHLMRAALIHDWQEAWFNDLASPIKNRPEMRWYKEQEHKAGCFIRDCMGVSQTELDELDQWDKRIYVNERDALCPVVKELGRGDELIALFDPTGGQLFKYTQAHIVYQRMLYLYQTLFPERTDHDYNYAGKTVFA